MDARSALESLIALSARHPEAAVELEDQAGRVSTVVFDGALHPECVKGPPVGDPEELARGSIYPKAPYLAGTHRDYEPLAYRIALPELAQILAEP